MRKVLIVLFFLVLNGVFAQSTEVDADSAALPKKQGLHRLSIKGGKVFFRGRTGPVKEILTPDSELTNQLKAGVAKNLVVNTVAELRALTGTAGAKCKRLGYYTAGDGGGDELYWNPTSTASDNGGTIFAVSGVSVGRWVSIQTDVVNIKQFGALMDGISNDSIYIKKAFDCGAKVYYIPSNGILATSGNVLNSTNVKKIYGNNSSIKLLNNAYRSIFYIRKADNLIIEGLKIDGNYFGNTLDNGSYLKNGSNIGVIQETALIVLDSCSNSSVKNIEVNYAFCSPIVLLNCNNSIINECISFNHLREGFGITGGAFNSISKCKSSSGNGILPWSCVFTKGNNLYSSGGNHTIIDNECINSQSAFFSINSNFTKVINNKIKKTASVNTTSGPAIRLGHLDNGQDSTLRAYNCVVSNNEIYNILSDTPFGGESGGRAISCDNASFSVIDNNVIDSCRNGIGISVSSLNQSITIKENKISNIQNTAIELYNCDKSKVISNQIYNCSKGIRVSAKNTVIDRNYIINNSSTGLELYYSAPIGIANTRITNNIVSDGAGVKYSIASRTSMFVKDNAGIEGVEPNYTVYSNSAPTSGYWVVGNTVYNTNPTTTTNLGWICTASGTPGTWVQFGNINNYASNFRVNTTVSTGEVLQVTGSTRLNGNVEISTTSGALVIPRMTQAQRLAITTPQNGSMVYQTDGTVGFYFYVNNTWVLK